MTRSVPLTSLYNITLESPHYCTSVCVRMATQLHNSILIMLCASGCLQDVVVVMVKEKCVHCVSTSIEDCVFNMSDQI